MISQITFTPAGGSPITLHSVAIGSTKVVTRAEGLQGAPPIREVKALKGQQHGAYNRSKWLDSRTITLEGEVIASSIESSFDAFDSIATAFASSISTPGTLKWTRDAAGQALQVSCQLGSLAPLVMTDNGNLLQYQVTLVANDPRVYDQATTTATGSAFSSSSTASFNNTGSITTPPIIRVYAGITNPVVKLNGTGTGLTFVGAVAADYMEIDVANRTIKTGTGGGTGLTGTTNVLSSLNAGVSDWFELPTGSGTVVLTGSSTGSPRVDLVYTPAFI